MRIVVVLSLLCLGGAVASAKDEPAPPRTHMNLWQAADLVERAFSSANEEVLSELAGLEHPDPWVVVAELCYRGKQDAAHAFALAGRRPATEKLAAYVTSRRGKPPDEASHAALEKIVRALGERKIEDAVAALPFPRAGTDTILGIQLAHLEGRLDVLRGRNQEAAEAYAKAGVAAERLGWLNRAGLSAAYACRLYGRLGNQEEASACFERGLAAWSAIKFERGVGSVLIEMATVAKYDGRTHDALGYYERALRALKKTGDEKGIAAVLHQLGMGYSRIGNYPRALENYERSLPLWIKVGGRADWAGAQINMGNVETSLGNFPKAIAHYERGLAEARAVQHDEYVANGLLNLAGVYWRVGNVPRALVFTEKALEKMKSGGRPDGVPRALSGLGLLRIELGDLEGAAELLGAAYAHAKILGDKQLEATVAAQLARAQLDLGNFPEARSLYERALALAAETSDRELQTNCTASLGHVRIREGKLEEGLEFLRQAERAARRLRARSILVGCLQSLTDVHLARGEYERAMYLAREARTEVEHLLGGLGLDDAATARGKYANLFANGMLAAVRIGDTAEAFTFLESGRAGALLELLGGRDALRWSALPEALRRAEAEANLREVRARAAYQRASAGTDAKAVRAAARALDAAQTRVREVHDRIRRESSPNTTALFYPRAATLEEVQGILAKDEALVNYAIARGEVLAFVLTSAGARVVELGSEDEVLGAVQALAVWDPEVDPGPTVAKAKKVLVAPLALPASVRRVLVSPTGALCYVPFAMLFDQPVALSPSATTHAFLRGEATALGKRVLALGDPSYEGASQQAKEVFQRGGALSALPASGPEAEAVGDTVLLGVKASEKELRRALGGQERWRAVHFACHGLVDSEKPLRSALALSVSPGHDGFLTAREVLRMDIPADLAVLSACDTSRGKIVRGEGIVGFMRAFMFAGASRVLCSLWKVDDAATMALMKRFYELWAGAGPAGGATAKPASGSLGAAAALAEAQKFVRTHPDHPEWKHPYYWAAWVMWGLGD